LSAEIRIELPPELLDSIIERVAELVIARLEGGKPGSRSDYLTVPEAADFLRCKPQRIYDLLSARRLTRYKDGGRVLVSRAELEAHLRGERALTRGRR
jgi:excisionase family DNA binding protein